MKKTRIRFVLLALFALAAFVTVGCGLQAAARPESTSSSAPSSKPSASRGQSSDGAQAKTKSNKSRGTVLTGKASYYHDSLAGRSTASGEPYNPRKLTAAHLKLPFGTMVRVTRVDNGKSVVVKVNDRGPYGGRGRIIDLSRRAAEEIDMIRAGVVDVEVEILED